jgi:hypothetical protein
LQELEIGTFEHAVLVDIGDHVAGAAFAVEALQSLPEVATLLRPTAGSQGGAPNVKADGDPVAMLRDGRGGPFGVLESSSAQVDPAATARQGGAQALGIPDPPGLLDLDVQAADDLGEQVPVGASPECCVEVNEMNPLRALLLPGQGSLPGVAELAAAARDSLDKLDCLAARDVDCRQKLKAWGWGYDAELPGWLVICGWSSVVGHLWLVICGRPDCHPERRCSHRLSSQFFSSWAPASPDFSG